MRGKLIVLEGMDASGKATQAKLLLGHLEKEGKKAELVSFPRYNFFFGKQIKRYLHGKLGEADPKLMALLYALDRYDAAPAIESSLENGKIVVLDRYSASNIAYQTARVKPREQQQFFSWIKRVEEPMPKPTISFFLDVPIALSQKLMDGRTREKDVYEKNTAYLEDVRQIYLKLCRQMGFIRIDCAKGNKIKGREEIHQLIWKNLSNIFK